MLIFCHFINNNISSSSQVLFLMGKPKQWTIYYSTAYIEFLFIEIYCMFCLFRHSNPCARTMPFRQAEGGIKWKFINDIEFLTTMTVAQFDRFCSECNLSLMSLEIRKRGSQTFRINQTCLLFYVLQLYLLFVASSGRRHFCFFSSVQLFIINNIIDKRPDCRSFRLFAASTKDNNLQTTKLICWNEKQR